MSSLEKQNRIRYIRALEKFAFCVAKILKKDDFEPNLFKKHIDKNYEILQKITPVTLNQPYTKNLVKFVNLAINSVDKNELLKEFNQLEKLKNSKTYKKDKHKKSLCDEY